MQANPVGHHIGPGAVQSIHHHVAHVNSLARRDDKCQVDAIGLRRGDGREVELGGGVTVVEIVIEHVVAIAGDVEIAVGLSFGGMQELQQRRSNVVRNALYDKFGNEPLGPFFNVDEDGDVRSGAVVIVKGAGGDLHIAEAIGAIEIPYGVQIALQRVAAIAAVAITDQSGGYHGHALADGGGVEIVIAVDFELNDFVP